MNENEALEKIEIIAIEKERLEREKNESLKALDVELSQGMSEIDKSEDRQMPMTDTEVRINLDKKDIVPGVLTLNERNAPEKIDDSDEDLEDFLGERERIYVDDKVYDYDEKKHGTRYFYFLISSYVEFLLLLLLK